MILTDVSLRNRITVGVLMVITVVAGAYSYVTLPREAAPEVVIPIVMVTTMYEGVSPEDVESAVTSKIEKELAGVKDLDEMTSASSEGFSTVVVQFTTGVDMKDALQRVRDKVDVAKSDLPDEADEPSIKEINVSEFPIMLIGVSGKVSPVILKEIADSLEDEFERIPGVLNADVSGALEREIRIEVDRDRLASYDLTMADLFALIPAENVNVSAGGIETEGTKFNVRVPAEFAEPGEIDYLMLAVRDGAPIYLSDVARVTDTFKDRLSFSRLDGVESITISVQKRAGANIIPISDRIKAILEVARTKVPMGVRLDVTTDFAKYIRAMVSDLENNIVSGSILVLAVLLMFTGLRTSLNVAMAIPLSMLMTFSIIQAMGYTLNMVVLFGTVMATGMLVDNAVVIVENIYRHMQYGKDKSTAARVATTEVAWPVITSTLTTLAAFFPLLFWPDVVGDFLKYLPITLIVALSCSMLVALVMNPVIASVLTKARVKARDERPPAILRGYRALLEFAMVRPLVTMALAGTLLVTLVALYGRLGAGVEFFPDNDPDQAVVNIRCPQGTNIRETDRITRIVESRVKLIQPDLEHVVTNVGSSGGANILFGGGGTAPHLASITLIFYDFEVRARPSAEAVKELRAALTDIPGAEIEVQKEQHGPPTGAPVTVRIIGDDFSELGQLSEKAKRMIADTPGLVNLKSDYEAAKPELAFSVDRRRAMMLGVNTAMVGNFLKAAIFGRNVGTYRQFNDEYDITVRLPVDERSRVDDVFSLKIPNVRGEPVPLSSLGEFDYRGGLGTISRVDQKRVITLSGDAEGRLGENVLKDVQKSLQPLDLPSGYRIDYVGEKEEQDKAQAFLQKAFIVAVLLITFILVAQFNSFIVPLVIMSTVVLSLVGVLIGLIVTHTPFGIIMTGIGVISLAGVVVNNAIVLLDYTEQLRARGLTLLAAAAEAGQTRLRPVFLTAITTVLGLIPMAVGVSFDFHKMEWATSSSSSQMWYSMAVAVIFGLSFATLLTLVVVPTLYVTLTSIWERFAGSRHAAVAPDVSDK